MSQLFKFILKGFLYLYFRGYSGIWTASTLVKKKDRHRAKDPQFLKFLQDLCQSGVEMFPKQDQKH